MNEPGANDPLSRHEATALLVDLRDFTKNHYASMKVDGRIGKPFAHSFRVATSTDLLEQGVSLEEVQHLAGHADLRTTRLTIGDRRRLPAPIARLPCSVAAGRTAGTRPLRCRSVAPGM